MQSSYIQSALFVMNRPEPIRQASLLMILAMGVGNGDSLLDGLRAHAEDNGSPWSDRILSLSLLLEQGLPLSAALAGNPGLLPDQTASAILIGESTGTLQEVLLDEAARLAGSVDRQNAPGFDFASTLLWSNAIGLVVLVVLTFVIVQIVPKFKRIFNDFGIELPALTTIVIHASDDARNYSILILPLVSGTLIGLTVVAFWSSWMSVTRGRMLLSEHLPRYWVPIVLRLLSIAAATENPFPSVMHSFLRELRPGAAAKVYSRLRYQLDAGRDFILSMHMLKLLSEREAAFLSAAQRNGHLDWGLRHLATEIERRRTRWSQRILNALEPMLILIVGGLVLLVVVGLFLPVVKLISDLA